VNKNGIILSGFVAHLPNGFQERKTFDVPDRPPDFNDCNIYILSDTANRGLDFIGNMGNYLNSLTEILPFSFFFYYGFIYFTGGGIVVLTKAHVRKPLIMAQIQIRFRSIICDKYFPVLERAHGAGINIDIGIQFQKIDFKPTGLQQTTDRSAGQPFSQG